MAFTIDPAKLADIQTVVDKLIQSPEHTLMYIAGYAEGSLDRTKNQKMPTASNQKEKPAS